MTPTNVYSLPQHKFGSEMKNFWSRGGFTSMLSCQHKLKWHYSTCSTMSMENVIRKSNMILPTTRQLLWWGLWQNISNKSHKKSMSQALIISKLPNFKRKGMSGMYEDAILGSKIIAIAKEKSMEWHMFNHMPCVWTHSSEHVCNIRANDWLWK